MERMKPKELGQLFLKNFPVDENGHIKSIVSCFGDDVKFEVTEENANLLETDIDLDESGKIDISSTIDENGHLIITI